MKLIVTLPWPPPGVNTNNQWRGAGSHVHQRPEALAYKNTVAVLTRQALIDLGGVVPDGSLQITVRQYRPDRRKRDVDSNVKIVLDGVARGLGIDDSRFRCLLAYLVAEPDKEHARIDVIVEETNG